MTRYARSDQYAIRQARGCGEEHVRPKDDNGNHVSLWALVCAPCEASLTDDPHWSGHAAEVPLTPEEERAKDKLVNEGNAAVQQMTAAMAALFAQGVTQQQQAGGVTCRCGTVAGANARFCAACGTSLVQDPKVVPAHVEKPASVEPSVKLDVPEPEPEAEVNLNEVHTLTLKKMARQRGLSDAGPRNDLIDRLAEASRSE